MATTEPSLFHLHPTAVITTAKPDRVEGDLSQVVQTAGMAPTDEGIFRATVGP